MALGICLWNYELDELLDRRVKLLLRHLLVAKNDWYVEQTVWLLMAQIHQVLKERGRRQLLACHELLGLRESLTM